MNLNVIFKMATKNIRLNKAMVVPFILSSAVMFITVGILVNMLFSGAIEGTLGAFLGFAIAIISFLTVAFMIYANGFLFKKRSREFSLYSVLGLEKKHIRRVIFLEQCIMFIVIAVISVLGTAVFSKVMFIISQGILRIDMSSIDTFKQTPISYIAVILGMGACFFVLWIVNYIKILRSSAISLMSYSSRAESEPKSRYILALLGILGIGYGYFIALTQKGSLKSLMMFFVAAFIVIIATYLIFIATSIVVLKKMKSNKGYFYKVKNFLTVSGLMFRVKSNATGLASITVLCTCVMVALSATVSVYVNAEATLDSQFPMEYRMDSAKVYDINKDIKEIKAFDGKAIEYSKALEKATGEKIKDMTVSQEFNISMVKNGEVFKPLGSRNVKSGEDPVYITVMTLDSFNKLYKKDLKWEGKIYYTSNKSRFDNMEKINLNGKIVPVSFFPGRGENGNLSIDNINLVVKDYDSMRDIENYIFKGDKNYEQDKTIVRLMMNWNVDNPSKQYEKKVTSCLDTHNSATRGQNKNTLIFTSKAGMRTDMYNLFGSILIFGISISIVFIIGSVLIIYYKQLSEAYEDRKRYSIMKSVGLSNDMIKKSMKSQITYMFFLPIGIAILNLVVSSKIVFDLLGILGITRYSQYGICELIVGAIFSVFYYTVFKITSRVYYSSIS